MRRYSAHSGNGLALRSLTRRGRFRTSPCAAKTRRTVAGETHTAADVAAAMRELAMRTVDIAPLLEQLEDRGHLLGSEPVHRRAGLAVIQAAGVTPAAPPPRPPLIQLEVVAGAAVIPPVGDRPVDQCQQLVLGGRVDAARDPATQSQRSFPSASINRTPISFNASDSRAISALAAASSGSAPPWRTPGRDARERVQRALLADLAQLHDRRAIDPARSAASTVEYSPRNSAEPDLILLRRREKPLRVDGPRRCLLNVPARSSRPSC